VCVCLCVCLCVCVCVLEDSMRIAACVEATSRCHRFRPTSVTKALPPPPPPGSRGVLTLAEEKGSSPMGRMKS
jgi:hypothetical protein